MLSDITKTQHSVTRSISPENFTGEKGKGGMAVEGTGTLAARDLGKGWKVSPSIMIQPNQSYTIAEIKGPGMIRHIWMTCFPSYWRELIIDIYWEGAQTPAVSVPFGDFFCNGWCTRSNVNSLPVVVNPAGGMNSYWQMPFKEAAKIVVRHLGTEEFPLYYQIDYSLEEISSEANYFCALWHRSKPLGDKEVHLILPKIKGSGHFVGTYVAYQSNSNGWWGEGEVKIYIDGDGEYPTYCGTGTEDYFGGAWNFEQPLGEYCSYSTPFMGLPQVIKPDGLYNSQQRFGMYRWHITDPFVFTEEVSISMQALGWRSEGRYLSLQDDISSTAIFYLNSPTPGVTPLIDKDFLEVN